MTVKILRQVDFLIFSKMSVNLIQYRGALGALDNRILCFDKNTNEKISVLMRTQKHP